MSQDVR
jgi:chromosome segregation ATPase